MGRDCDCPDTEISASAVSSWARCKRLWGFAKLEGFRSQTTESQALGLEVHAQIEAFLEFGKPLDLTRESGQIALAGADLWPTDPSRRVETHFRHNGMHGFLDISSIDPFGMPIVWDHKTTKGFGHAKDILTIRSDIQAASYADAAMALTGQPKAGLRWIYYRTVKPYKRLPIFVNVTRDDIAPALAQITVAKREISSIMTLPKTRRPRALDLEPTASACFAFGRECDFSSICNLSDAERLGSLMTQGNYLEGAKTHAELLAEMEAQAAGLHTSGQAPPGPGVNPPWQPPAAQAPPPPPGAPPYGTVKNGYVFSPPGQWVVQAPPPPVPPAAPAYAPPPPMPAAPVAPPAPVAPVAPVQAVAAPAKRGRKPNPDAKARLIKAATDFAMAMGDLFETE